jgi:hypothetical protein
MLYNSHRNVTKEMNKDYWTWVCVEYEHSEWLSRGMHANMN